MPDCAGCRKPRPAFTTARSAVVHEAAPRSLLTVWKDHGLHGLAGVAADITIEVLHRPEADVAVPVPAARQRADWRGHDGPRVLAATLARRWGLDVEAGLLHREHERPQRGLGAAERRRNARTAIARHGDVSGAMVLVIDDVFTTGATASACARALLDGGARAVHVVTFARAPLTSRHPTA